MAIKLTWLGHATWKIQAGQTTILLDPFLEDNPSATEPAADQKPHFILISHGHADHFADAESIAKSSGATVLCIYEIAQWLTAKGVENCIGMNIGGTFRADFGSVKMVRAEHSSSFPDGSYAGCPAGFVIQFRGDEALDGASKSIYFACDTGVFSDMEWIGSLGIDVAVLPIGDLFTMGPEDSLRAIQLLKPGHVLPTHFNTWPPIEQDAQAWSEKVQSNTSAAASVLAPGETFEI